MIKNWIVCIIVLLVVSGCTGEACIEADNFGHSQVVVSARYDKKDLKDQVRGQQIAPWVNSHYYLNGKPLMLSVKHWNEKTDYNMPSDLSAWCAWYGSGRHDATLSRICERLPECQFIDNTMCTDSIDAKISNAPCIFKDGVGLYALMAKKGTDPNATLQSKESPLGINFHV
ncbi:MAG: hypothetical protein P8P83_01430 [Rickettsiaceae bacterium]|nr:hypothetical protein [Rickettsiaceae bacterium]